MATPCGECGRATVWDDEAGSSVCTGCGTLVDANQSILTSNQGFSDNGRQYSLLWDPTAASTLKSARTGGWDIAGQGKETRDRRNTYAMNTFIQSISATMGVPGLAPRATVLFSQAKAAGRYRWGRKVKLAAGAALAIALRESDRADSLRDIAFLLDETPVSVTRAFRAIVTLLHLPLSPADPSQHLASLQAHFTTIISAETSTSLPKALAKILRTVSLPSVMRLAKSLVDVLDGLSPQVSLLSTPPTAIAVYMLSLEAETRAAFSNMGDLATGLALRFGLAKGVVLERYKVVQDAVEEWIREVPWLDQFESKTLSSGKARSKISKRLVVARGLKDVLQFKEEILKKRTQTLQRPKLVLESAGDAGESDSDSEFTSSSSTAGKSSSYASTSRETDVPRKRRKLHHTLDDASLFLLDPLSSRTHPRTASRASLAAATPPPLPRAVSFEPSSLTSYLLSAPASSISFANLPTRLQRLAAERGGSGPAEIPDEDLFDEGELDGIIRNPAEIQDLTQILGLGVWHDHDPGGKKAGGQHPTTKDTTTRRSQKRGAMTEEKVVGSKRINMQALTQILQGENVGDESSMLDPTLLSFDDDKDWDYDDLREVGLRGLLEEIEDVGDWRPPSAGGADCVRYEEDCG